MKFVFSCIRFTVIVISTIAIQSYAYNIAMAIPTAKEPLSDIKTQKPKTLKKKQTKLLTNSDKPSKALTESSNANEALTESSNANDNSLVEGKTEVVATPIENSIPINPLTEVQNPTDVATNSVETIEFEKPSNQQIATQQSPVLPQIEQKKLEIEQPTSNNVIPTLKQEAKKEEVVESILPKDIKPIIKLEPKKIEKTEQKSEQKSEQKPTINSSAKKSEESMRDKYLNETKFAQKDDRGDVNLKYGNTMHHAEVDSDLILNRYEKKQFIKEKITEIAKAVVKKDVEYKKSIAEQMGATGSRRISVSIDETVAIKDAIMEVSNLSGIDVEVDPEVEGSIIISVKNTKAADVFERMAELAQLNISVRENIVRFTSNKSFTKNYTVSFIDNMNTGVNGSQMVSPSIGANGNANTNPYNNQQMNQGYNNMNAINNPYGNQQYGTNVGGGVNMSGGGVGVNSLTSLQSSASNSFNMNNSMWDQFENGLKYIVSQKKDVSYSINKQAGIVTLRAPLIIHKEIEEYIDRVKKVATTQILVEVRLVEVQLNDEFATGVNFGGSVGDGNWNITNPFNAAPKSDIATVPFALTFSGGGLTAAVQFLQSFGTTKAIASPRLNVMNNQKSRLSFARDSVYFSIQPQLQNQYINMTGSTSGATNPIIVQSTMHTVPIGVILDLQATADIEKDEITMNIHPVLSSILTYANDPAATFLSSLSTVSSGSRITNAIPVVEKKELNSTLRIRSGDIMVIGGFNEEKTIIHRAGIPYLKDIPYLKVLFGFNTKSVANVETVIFIKATIMTPEKSINEQDVKFYNDFA